MNKAKTVFSIKDLENLSGIKAHTIRIWEKRYNVLEPMRTETNIRLYDLPSLQKLLNITLLHDYGYKISKISKYPPEKIPNLVREIISDKNKKNLAINAFKIAMLNYDQQHFMETYNALIKEKSFSEIFSQVFIPLMDELGILWQSDTISPAQEHFLSYLIKQQLIVNTELIQQNPSKRTDRIFVLYLPINEIHEMGLMYINYEIIKSGYKTIFLGESLPAESLIDISKHFDNVTFVTYMTVQPEESAVNSYIKFVSENILKHDSELWTIGRQTAHIDISFPNPQVKVFHSITSLLDEL